MSVADRIEGHRWGHRPYRNHGVHKGYHLWGRQRCRVFGELDGVNHDLRFIDLVIKYSRPVESLLFLRAPLLSSMYLALELFGFDHSCGYSFGFVLGTHRIP